MCLTQIKQAQIKFPRSGFWTVCTEHILADAGEREVNLLETWDIKPFA
jgi:hypothetical protein